MKHKKTLALIAAMVLVCTLSVAGTLAYLTATTSAVTNTFTAAGLIDNNHFTLTESKAKPDETQGIGHYTLDTDDPVTGNNYTVVPNVDIPKDPRITIDADKLEQNAYLFVEVVDSTPDTLSWTIAENWNLIADEVGEHGGKIYYYDNIVLPSAEKQEFFLINEDTIDVATTYEAPAAGSDPQQIIFYAYLSQSAGFGDAEAAWSATFAKNEP